MRQFIYSLLKNLMFRDSPYQNGKAEFPIVKDTKYDEPTLKHNFKTKHRM